MRKPMPLHWIEEAEARHVLATAIDEAPPPGRVAAAPWAARLRRWFAVAAPHRRTINKPNPAPRPESL